MKVIRVLALSSAVAFGATGFGKTIISVPTIPDRLYTGEALSPQVPASPAYSADPCSGVSAGEYDVVLWLSDPENYAWEGSEEEFAVASFRILQAENSWTVGPEIEGWTYGDPSSVPLAAAKFGTPSVRYDGETFGGLTVNDAFAVTEAGNYIAKFVVTGNGDWKGLLSNVAFTVKKAIIVGPGGGTSGDDIVLDVQGWSGAYDGFAHSISVVATGSDFTVLYSVDEEGPWSPTCPSFTEAGSYTVWFRISSSEYETFVGSETVAIEKATVDVPSVPAKTYTGEVQFAGIAESDDYRVLFDNGWIDAGTYGLVLVLENPENYKWSANDDPYLPVEFTILPVEVDLSDAEWDYVEPFVYDGGVHAVTLTGLPDGVIVRSYLNNASSDAGVFTASVELDCGANHIAGAVDPCEWKINPKSVEGGFVLLGPALVYTGAPQTQTVGGVTTADGQLLRPGDYDVSGATVTEVGSYTLTVTGKGNFTGSVTARFSVYTAEGADLKDALDGAGSVESDGHGGWTVTVTNDISHTVEIADNLGDVTIDLEGHDLVGTSGATGDAVSIRGGNGEPAIRVFASGKEGVATRLKIIDSVFDETDDVIGGRGGDGTPGGNGGAGVQVLGGVKDDVLVDVGPGVGICGGVGGVDLSGESRGGHGGAGIDGNVGLNEGAVSGGAGGGSESGRGGSGGDGVTGDAMENDGRISGGSGGDSEHGRGGSGGDAVGGSIGGGSGSAENGTTGSEPTIAVQDGGKSGAENVASTSNPYDGEGHGIVVTVTEPREGALVRYALSAEGPFYETNPLFTNVVDRAPVWYEVSAEGYGTVTNWATVTVKAAVLNDAVVSSVSIVEAGGVRTPRAQVVDGFGRSVDPDNYVLTWKENASSGMRLTFTGRNNYVGSFVHDVYRLSFEVTFDANGGVVDTEKLTYDIGRYYDRLPTPSRPGYLFDGWYESPSFESATRVTRSTEVIADDVTLYAKWNRRALWYTEVLFHVDAASVWNGYVLGSDEGCAGTIQVKVAKPNRVSGICKVTATLQLLGEKKITLKGETFDGRVTATAKDGRELDLQLFECGMSGRFGAMPIDGSRNIFTAKDEDSKQIAAQTLKNWQGTYVSVFNEGAGYSTFSITVGAKGSVKVTGTLVDGTKVSGKSQLLVGERECAIAFSWAKKKSSVSFLVWFCEDGTVEMSNLHNPAVVARIVNQKEGAYLREGAVFLLADTNVVVTAFGGGVLTGDFLPHGEPVVQDGSKWKIEKPGAIKAVKGEITTSGTNFSGLKLTYKLKDSTFKGSFTVYSVENGRLKKYKMAVQGVVLVGKAYGTATCKRPAVTIPITIE